MIDHSPGLCSIFFFFFFAKFLEILATVIKAETFYGITIEMIRSRVAQKKLSGPPPQKISNVDRYIV